MTVGSSLLEAAWLVDDPSKLWSNDVIEMSHCLGIEAATLLQNAELQRVISFDSTYVEPRHTMLLTETMTRLGKVSALNRHKMKDLGTSLISRATFEQTLAVLEEGAYYSTTDKLEGSLERQIVGLPVRLGTGAVCILQEKQTITNQVFAPLDKLEYAIVSSLPTLQTTNIAPLSLDWNPYSLQLTDEIISLSNQYDKLVNSWWKLVSNGTECILRGYSPNIIFDRALSYCSSYKGWDETEIEWIHSTRVDYDGRSTIVNYPDGARAIKYHVTKTEPTTIKSRVSMSIFCVSPVHTSILPYSVIPTQVTIRHRKTFSKDGWVTRFTKQWSAKTLLECEALVLTRPPINKVDIDCNSREFTLPPSQTMILKLFSLE